MNMREMNRSTMTCLLTAAVMADLSFHASLARAQDRQKQEVEEEFCYELKIPQLVHAYSPRTETCAASPDQDRIAAEGLHFVVLRPLSDAAGKHYVIRFPTIKPESPEQLRALANNVRNDPADRGAPVPPTSAGPPDGQNRQSTLADTVAHTRETFITSEDNGKYFCLEQDKFDALLASNVIGKVYRRGRTGEVYGLSLMLPFKLRPATGGFNTKLTEAITIAGGFSERWRISNSRDYHADFPVVTAGLTTLDLEMGTAPSAMTSNKQLLGLTVSLGAVLELANFQLGFMMGIDRAPGEDGKGWIYNDKIWYSFAIGYSFLNSATQ